MIILQARIMFIAFVALAAAITYNAVFLQNGPHPAPMAKDATNTDNGLGIGARERPKYAKTLPKHTRPAASATLSKTILAVQRRLAENGYEPGPPDGVQGVMTRAAIMAYQADNGLALTGEASDRLLKQMILGISPGDEGGNGPASIPEQTTELIKAVQLTLTKLGYDPGPADGLWGAATRKAIERFEQAGKLTVKGQISAPFIKHLMQANGGGFSKLKSS